MKQLIIKNGKIIATHEEYQDIAHLYPNCECILWDKELPIPTLEIPFLDDPRTEEDKKLAYLDKRRLAYPSVQEQLDMIYHDIDNWREKIREIKERFPK